MYNDIKSNRMKALKTNKKKRDGERTKAEALNVINI